MEINPHPDTHTPPRAYITHIRDGAGNNSPAPFAFRLFSTAQKFDFNVTPKMGSVYSIEEFALSE